MNITHAIDMLISDLQAAQGHIRRNEFRKADDVLNTARMAHQLIHQEVWLNHHNSGEVGK
jgi:hypothetical protein